MSNPLHEQRLDAPGSAAVVPQRTSNAVWWGLLVVHIVWILAGLEIDPLWAGAGTASTVFLLFAWYARSRRALLSFAPPLAFVGLNTFSFGYVNLLYIEATELPRGENHDTLAWLTVYLIAATAVGASCMHALLGRDALPARVTSLVRSSQTLFATSALFALIVIAQVSTGWLDARWSGSSDESFGLAYLVQGLGPIGYIFFLILGTRLSGPLTSTKNLAILSFVGILGLIQGLSGGRGASMFMVLLLIAGGVWGDLTRRQVRLLIAGALVIGIPFAIIIGDARARSGFGYGSVEDRTRIISQAAQETQSATGTDDRPSDALISRLFELSAVVVIDQTLHTGHYAGFEDFDRLQYLFVPKYLAPDKQPISNGTEILIREFGYRLDDKTGVPICLVADAFRRGGELWVICVGFLAGAMLRLLSRLALKTVGPDFAPVAILLYVLTGTGAHGESVLGLINFLTYLAAKMGLLLLMLRVSIRLLIALTRRSVVRAAPTRFGGANDVRTQQ